jgi:outer membrane protein OmpA-like peptidoglycan-associated protein
MLSKALVVAAALAALSACDKATDSRAGAQKAPGASAGASQTPSTPANLPAPTSQAEKREGANPVQGQVDPKEREQHKDFQQKGDAAGPTGPDTTPRK